MADALADRAEKLGALGDRLAACFAGGAGRLSGLTPLTSRDEAYAIQDAMLSHIGRAAGWKVGRGKAGPEPYCAPIAESRVLASGDTWRHDKAPVMHIEAEIAFILGRDIPAGSGPITREECLQNVRAIAPAIEILGTRIGEPEASDALWKLADLQANAGAVLGPEVAWRGQPLSPIELTVDCPGLVRASSQPAHPFGDPVGLLCWLANHVATRRGGLRAGDFIITGSYCGILEITQPGPCIFTFPGIGEVCIGWLEN